MTARWEDALDAQMEFSAACSSNSLMRHYIHGWMQSYNGKGPDTLGRVSDYEIERTPDFLSAIAFNADAVWVDTDMMTVWEAALEGFQPEPLVPEDLICPVGFLYFARPFYSNDIHGKRTSHRAIMWAPREIVYRGAGLGIVEKAMGELPAPYTVKMGDMTVPVAREGDSLSADGIMFMVLHDARDRDDYSHPNLPSGLLIDHMMPWPFGSRFDDPRGQLPDSILAYQALWRLMQQTLAVRSVERPDRATRRRLARAKMAERKVTVIRLRRPEPEREKGEPKIVHWSHRWLVGGHWRNQPYPSLGIRRQIWISPYVKGPADMPLDARKARVFALVR